MPGAHARLYCEKIHVVVNAAIQSERELVVVNVRAFIGA